MEYVIAGLEFADLLGPMTASAHVLTADSWSSWRDEVIAGRQVGFCKKLDSEALRDNLLDRMGCAGDVTRVVEEDVSQSIAVNSYLRRGARGYFESNGVRLNDPELPEIVGTRTRLGLIPQEIEAYLIESESTCANQMLDCPESLAEERNVLRQVAVFHATTGVAVYHRETFAGVDVAGFQATSLSVGYSSGS